MRQQAWWRGAGLVLVAIIIGTPQMGLTQSRGEKFRRGLANTGLGVMEISNQVRSCPTHPDFMPLTDQLGLFKYPFCFTVGLIGAGTREAFGMVELVTAPVPWPWRDYASPYESLWIADDYPWQ